MKIVINKCYGGYGLSETAFLRLQELGLDVKDSYDASQLERNNPILIQVIEELGCEAASGQLASLKIVEIPDDVKNNWYIDEYDGIECVNENHRAWS